MWAAVPVDVVRQQYDICYGAVTDLENKCLIPMSANDRARHKKLAYAVTDKRIRPEWSNVGTASRAKNIASRLGSPTETAQNRIMIFGRTTTAHMQSSLRRPTAVLGLSPSQ